MTVPIDSGAASVYWDARSVMDLDIRTGNEGGVACCSADAKAQRVPAKSTLVEAIFPRLTTTIGITGSGKTDLATRSSTSRAHFRAFWHVTCDQSPRMAQVK